MNKDIVLQSCFDASACLSSEWSDKEAYLQLQLAGFIDLFRKAVTEENIQGRVLQINDAKLAEASATITELSECDSLFRENHPKAWQGLRALRPAVNAFLESSPV